MARALVAIALAALLVLGLAIVRQVAGDRLGGDFFASASPASRGTVDRGSEGGANERGAARVPGPATAGGVPAAGEDRFARAPGGMEEPVGARISDSGGESGSDRIERDLVELARILTAREGGERRDLLTTFADRAETNPGFRSAIEALALLDPERALALLATVIQAGPGPRFETAFLLATDLHPTAALTLGAEILNSDMPAATRVAVAGELVTLVDRHPHLEQPTLSTLQYAGEAYPDTTVQRALDSAGEEIRRRSSAREWASDVPRGGGE
ncbi:MAG: hypothetical protein HY720_30225 [Planctomycetes bacterium]|nr:hypothetical protein [Planctomycetota bacterium]